MNRQEILNWLLKGDISIQYQVYRDLLSIERKDLQNRIAYEGWGARILANRNPDGHWGKGFYQPKWISSHYTLLELRNLCIAPDHKPIQDTITKILKECKAVDGGIYLKTKISDVCVNGMFLNYASYFKADEKALVSVIDALILEQMGDGGFNCRSNRSGATHSSLHSTLSVLEGMTEYERNGYIYQIDKIKEVINNAKEFILWHQLYISDRTGKIINKDFLRLSYPRRWRYDILSALDYFQYSQTNWDERMQPAIDYLMKKRKKDGKWNVQAKHPGQTHFDMEKAGRPSRWNTLRAMRVLNYYNSYDRPMIIFVFGLPGSGKSYFAKKLASVLQADYINSDRIRKDMFPIRTYSASEKDKVYDVMLEKMQATINQKKNQVLDATFHRKETRELFIKNTQKAKYMFIEVQASENIIRERLKKSRPYSEADYKVYTLIKQEWEPLEETHLELESNNENIDCILQKALEYLKNDRSWNT